jgi:hypothetical protein
VSGTAQSDNVPSWQRLCVEIGMTDRQAFALMAACPTERTQRLIRWFHGASDDKRRRNTIVLIHHIGDVETSGNFYARVLEDAAVTHQLKFWVSVWGRLSKFSNHQTLHEALDGYLSGESPVKVLFRNLFPNGKGCDLTLERSRLNISIHPRDRIRKRSRKKAGIVGFSEKSRRDDT